MTGVCNDAIVVIVHVEHFDIGLSGQSSRKYNTWESRPDIR